MNIEITGREELPNVLSLQRLCYGEAAARYDDRSLQPLTQTLEELEEEWRDHIILMIRQGGAVIGSVRGYKKDDTCYIGKLIVHPDFQNKGLGAQLMNKIERVFGDARRYELFTGYRDEKNLYLYNKLGYRTFREKAIHEGLTILFMEKIPAVAAAGAS